jgi:uncharacterized protein YkwD
MRHGWLRIGGGILATALVSVSALAWQGGALALAQTGGGVSLKLTIAATVSHPLLVDVAHVKVSPSGTAYTLQTRRAGTSRWFAAPDTLGVWGTAPGSFAVRAVTTNSDDTQVTSNVATVTVKNGKVPSWLAELNHYRALNNAAPVAQDPSLSHADALHVRYMIKTGDFTHYENTKSKWYTAAGARAGTSSDLAEGIPDPINAWARAPYHALSEVGKYGTLAGFAQAGGYAALWVDVDTSVRVARPPFYQYPANGKTTSLLTFYGDETPNPVANCPRPSVDADRPYGLPIIYGNAKQVSHPSATVTANGKKLRTCVVNAGEYGDAVFVIPWVGLRQHETITVSVSYQGKLQSRWRFKTR